MKLYFNRNFSGYHWFEIDDILNRADVIQYTTDSVSGISNELLFSKSKDNREHEIVGYLSMSGTYNSVFLKDKGSVILAIKGIKEADRRDEINRGLNMAMILVADISEFDLLHKIMLYQISSMHDDFNARFTAVFSNNISGIECNVKALKSLFKEIESLLVIPSAHKLCSINVQQRSYIYSIISDYEDSTIASSLNLKVTDVKPSLFSSKTTDKILLEKNRVGVTTTTDELTRLRSEINALKAEIRDLKSKPALRNNVTWQTPIEIFGTTMPIYYTWAVLALIAIIAMIM